MAAFSENNYTRNASWEVKKKGTTIPPHTLMEAYDPFLATEKLDMKVKMIAYMGVRESG